ncbi:MAG: exo-alpha-sialidase [Treponema sp.]|nr:exo-alpha-sialidase [Treponema sp.]
MKKSILFLTLLFSSVLMFADAPFSASENLFNQENKDTLDLNYPEGCETFTVFKADGSGDNFCNGAVLVSFKGKLYCQWQSSLKDEDAPDTKVVYAVSEDNGKSWSKPMVLVPTIEKGYRSSGGWWVNGKELIAFINEWPSDISPRGGFTYYTSTKNGKKWSKLKPVKMADGSPMNGIFEQDPHALPDGRIINAAHFQTGLYICPIYTDDKSATKGWKKGNFTPKDSGSNTSIEMEPSWFYNADGNPVMIFRDQKSSFFKLAAISKDRGENWSESELTNLRDARTKQSAGNLPDGTVFSVGNTVDNKLRSPLTITLSKDGKLFDKAFLLRSNSSDPEVQFAGKAKRKGFHYPKSYVAGDYLFVAYTTNKELVEITRIPLKSLAY